MVKGYSEIEKRYPIEKTAKYFFGNKAVNKDVSILGVRVAGHSDTFVSHPYCLATLPLKNSPSEIWGHFTQDKAILLRYGGKNEFN